jgi:hypothetical protein
MNDQPSQSNRNVILHKILNEEVSMRPKALFRARLALAIFLIILIAAISIFLFSFISFLIRTTSQDKLLGFGLSGVKSFIFLFPWFLFLVDIVLIAFLEYLLRQFRFGYSHSIVYVSFAIIVVVALFGIAIDRETSIHDSLLQSADADSLPLFSGLYERAHAPLPHEAGVCRCVITSALPLTARDDEGKEKFSVRFADSVPSIPLVRGDHVFMLGTFSDNTFYVQQIRVEPKE